MMITGTHVHFRRGTSEFPSPLIKAWSAQASVWTCILGAVDFEGSLGVEWGYGYVGHPSS